MIVRTYSRRSRDMTQTFSDPLTLSPESDSPDLGEFSNYPLSQDSALDRYNHNPNLDFSSQESSFEPDPVSRRGRVGSLRPTATLTEAQEFGEMMEHVDEVNFAIDGLRNKHPLRIRRASLVSLMNICETAQQRRVLRAQGMAKKIIDAVLGLNFDDSASAIAAATLFFILSSDVQDDHLLDSPPCINFLLKLLSTSKTETTASKSPTVASLFLGMRKPQIPKVPNLGMDSSSKTIIMKVHDILLSCKEIKSGTGDEEEMCRRPELSSQWISLLTMEKACLSTVSFEDTSETMRNSKENFKEKLRELGGLDAIFDIVLSCHSTLERRSKRKSLSVSELKDQPTLESAVLLLKCLKILENATFLSKDNQDHLLSMKGRINSEFKRFVGVVISSIKYLSDLALFQHPSNGNHSPQAFSRENKRGYLSCDGIEDLNGRNKLCHKRQKLFSPLVELSDSASEMTASCSDEGSYLKSTSLKLDKKTSGLKMNIGANGSKAKSDKSTKNSGGWIPIKIDPCPHLKKHMPEDVKGECSTDSYDPFAFDEDEFKPTKWDRSSRKKDNTLQVTTTNAEPANDYDDLRKKTELIIISSSDRDSQKTSENDNQKARKKDKAGQVTTTNAVPANDCDDLRKETDLIIIDSSDRDSQKVSENDNKKARKKDKAGQVTTTNAVLANDCDDLRKETDLIIIDSSDRDSQKASENDCPSAVEEDSNLLEDCLLASIKVLMNLTNDNPVGCQQIADFGGLDTMVSLMVNHFPSYDPGSPINDQLENSSSSSQSTKTSPLNSKRLTGHALDFLVAILGLLVNIVEKDSQNRLRLASIRVLAGGPGAPETGDKYSEVIPFLCSVFLANQGAGEPAEEEKILVCDDEALLQGEQEAEMMIVEAYAALLLAFLSTESDEIREEIACCLPNHNLEILVPVLERFVAFHLTLNMISPETHSAVKEIIESCKGP